MIPPPTITIESKTFRLSMTSELRSSDTEDTACRSPFQFCQLVEVGVVVRDVETVDPGARFIGRPVNDHLLISGRKDTNVPAQDNRHRESERAPARGLKS